MSKFVLGLDLGPNSIGWALIDDHPTEPAQPKLVDVGVRVFPEGVDNFDTSKELSRNEDRRIARGMRRQIRRRARRRRLLKEALVNAKLWPADLAQEAALYDSNPYDLRARGLHERLEPFEIGRVLLHLNQRRGFLSNRKKDRGDKEVQGMLAEINENEHEREAGGFKTIGAWLADKQSHMDHCHRVQGDQIRSRHLARAQYDDEFEAIWTVQAKHFPKLLTDELKYGKLGKQKYPAKPIAKHDPRRRELSLLQAFGIYGLIFFQRPMYWPKSVVGLCELEPRQKRCPRADRRVQRFRLLQEVNNLKFIDPDRHAEQQLNDEQRTLLIDKLSRTKEMTFDQIRKALGFLESVKFNLERGERSKLKGAPIDALFAAKTILGAKWYDRPDEERSQIVAILLDNERDDDQIVARAVSEWGMTPHQAEAILAIDLPAGYSSLSLKAIEKLLPHLERGLLYMDDDESNSALHAAGYLRRDQLQRRIFDKLPDPRRVRDCPIGDIPNPVVKRTLTELRKVVNAIIREYGKPAAVHLEMARSVQMGKEKRSEYNKNLRNREAERDSIADKLRENGVRVNRENILKYELWEQQNHECVYSGKPISFDKLFGEGGGVEVDHILPYKRTLDDSQMNKVVCLREANAGKADNSPHEWIADTDPKRYEQVCQRAGRLMRAGKMPYPKYRRFIQKELELDKFIARQLSDTGYITRATLEYVRCLFEKGHDVLGLKGQLTAELRWQWGLDTILEELPDSPAWHEADSGNLRPGEKNRADHRHHAIDAVVLALTNRRRLHQLSAIFKRGGARAHGEVLEDPWPNFRDDVLQAVKKVNVSHRVERKVAGKLHEDTFYGPTGTPGEWVVRKPVIALSANEIERIRDARIRQIVADALQNAGIDFGRGKKPDVKKMKEVLSKLAMPSGVPIKNVRLTKPEQTIQPVRVGQPDQAFVKPGSTHHLCVFEYTKNGQTKREAVFVTMLEAINRLKRHERVIQRSHPEHPDARFIMSLSGREMMIGVWDGMEKLVNFSTAASTTGQMLFVEHTDARKSSECKKYSAKATTLEARKVTVDPLGRIRWAND
jgi:CRISPR-associated endonuclease Csn1